MEKLLLPILNNKNVICESKEQKIKRLKEYFSLSHGKGRKNNKKRGKNK